MATSLDKLVNNLAKDAFNNVKRHYAEDKISLLTRKGIYPYEYPYEYMNSSEKLKETKLRPKEAFYSRLNDEGISDEDYQHARKVWETFEMKNLKDYHNLYNQVDVLLLADVFENFRDICIKNYKLDPAHYYTAPGLAWDAALKATEVKLELLTDMDMLLMVEKGIRGGIPMVSTRYSKANNKYMGDSFDSSKPSKYIQYLDANNLYGWAMSKSLPTHGFKWMEEDERNNWKNYSCILEVDLEYPKSENLKQYLNLGLKLTHIHRGIRFEESQWLKKYIALNTDLRTKAKNDFEKDFFKLMNNSVFGKAMENIRNRVDIKLVNNENKAEKL